MALPRILCRLRIPAVGAPLFIISNPDLVIAQCTSGIVGSFPALNAREKDGEPIELERWLTRITEALDRHNQANPDRAAAPYKKSSLTSFWLDRTNRELHSLLAWTLPQVLRILRLKVE
jgi:nitronate monooxygenase